MRQPETRTEFQIHNEDFPALPGSQEPKPGNLVNKQLSFLFDFFQIYAQLFFFSQRQVETR